MRHALVSPLLGLAALCQCSPSSNVSAPPARDPAPAGARPVAAPPPAEPPAKEATADDTASAEPVFSGPLELDRVAVYPITLAVQDDIGPVITLEEALQKGVAIVREVGGGSGGEQAAEDAAEPIQMANEAANAPQRQVRNANPLEQAPVDTEQIQRMAGNAGGEGGATVNTLVIENRGEVPIFVLAGTVVKGGRQDRQIGQDFIVQAKQTLPVDALCVEQGRWPGTREGAVTGGRFTTAPILANSKVRAAAQYKKNQGEVWAEVADTNKKHGKQAASGTLFATLDAADVAAKLERLAARIDGALGALIGAAARDQLVGMAWAVDGRLVGVRWFAHHRLFELARPSLVRTAAVDAITAESAGEAPAGAEWPKASAILTTIAEVEAQAEVERRKTEGGNDNEYKESARAWGSKTVLKPAKANGKAKPVAFDYIVK